MEGFSLSTRPIVELHDVCKVYSLGEVQVHALRGVSLTIEPGEAIAIMGPSGSGKTTLLNLIGALDRPSSGCVIIDGTDITALPESELTRIRREKISFVFQFFNLLPVLTAYENVELPLLIAGIEAAARRERVKHLLELVGLSDRAEHRPDELSGGEQQRVAIARALAKPRADGGSIVVLADEPTGDLDTHTGNEVMEVLIQLTREEGGTLIVVTHDPDVGKRLGRVYRMRDGMVEGIDSG